MATTRSTAARVSGRDLRPVTRRTCGSRRRAASLHLPDPLRLGQRVSRSGSGARLRSGGRDGEAHQSASHASSSSCRGAQHSRSRMTEPNVGILALTRSPEREDKYRWLVKVVTDDLVLVGGQGVDVSSLDKVKDRPIGVLLRSAARRHCSGRRASPASSLRPRSGSTPGSCKERRIDAWLAPRLMVIWAYKEVRWRSVDTQHRDHRAPERDLARRLEKPLRR